MIDVSSPTFIEFMSSIFELGVGFTALPQSYALLNFCASNQPKILNKIINKEKKLKLLESA